MAEAAERVYSLIYETYIIPARARGERKVTVQVLDVWAALKSAYTMEFIRGVLGSAKFRNTYHLVLAAPFPEEILPASYSFELQRGQAVSRSG